MSGPQKSEQCSYDNDGPKRWPTVVRPPEPPKVPVRPLPELMRELRIRAVEFTSISGTGDRLRVRMDSERAGAADSAIERLRDAMATDEQREFGLDEIKDLGLESLTLSVVEAFDAVLTFAFDNDARIKTVVSADGTRPDEWGGTMVVRDDGTTEFMRVVNVVVTRRLNYKFHAGKLMAIDCLTDDSPPGQPPANSNSVAAAHGVLALDVVREPFRPAWER